MVKREKAIIIINKDVSDKEDVTRERYNVIDNWRKNNYTIWYIIRFKGRDANN